MTEFTLGQLIDIHNGRDHKHLDSGDIPVYGSGGIMRYANDWLYDGEAILLPRKGTLNNIMYASGKLWTVDTMYYASVNEDVNAYYLYHYISLLELSHLDSGSTLPSMTQGAYNTLKVALPSKLVQDQTAKILSDLDSKISLNNKINAELESMAKLIYDYWFVQFDFPISKEQAAQMGKPELEGKPYKAAGGKMVYNAKLKREIPEGWGVLTINESVEKIIDHRGKTPTKLGGTWSENKDDIIALSAKVVKNGDLVNLDGANRVSKELFDKWMPEKLRDGDILMTSEAPAGETYFILGKTDYCLSQRLFALRPNRKLIPSFLYYEILRGNPHYQIQGSLSGSTVFGIRQDVLRTINVLVPKIEIQKEFDEKVLPMLRQIKALKTQNQKLAELRDWLLPMLMNGQVRVSSAYASETEGEGLRMVAEDKVNYKE